MANAFRKGPQVVGKVTFSFSAGLEACLRVEVEIEQTCISNMKYYFDDRCTMLLLTTEQMNSCGVDPAEFDGLASIPLQVEGVQIGITVKQRHEDVFKISVRTADTIDASAFCQSFGGGGHIRAAGCEITGTLEEVEKKLLDKVKSVLDK